MLNASIVDQNIQSAKALFRCCNHRLDFGGLAHISAMVIDLNTTRFHTRNARIFFSKAIHHDVGALLG